MRAIKFLSFLSIVSIIIISCNSTNTNSTENTINLPDSIKHYEVLLFDGDGKNITPDDALKLANYYKQYATENMSDSLSPDYLFKSADIFMNMYKGNEAINSFNLILDNFPEYKKTASALFLKAFVYEDQMQDYANAEKYYKLFLEKYPDSDFADDAEISIKNLGKTPEELIKEFENMNK
jgi:tetratricopeptide (TPR) repeat protein